jgi:membrane-bound lytic murein transglycosylase F
MLRLSWVLLSLLLGLWAVELAWAGVAKRATLPLVTDDRWTAQYDRQFRKYSKRYFGPQFDWRWFKAQAIIESKLNPGAVGRGGPRGLMQIKPATLKSLQRLEPRLREKLSGAEANIAAGIYYNRYLYDLWTPTIPVRERLFFAFASYNAGHAKILRAYKGVKSTTWRPVSTRAPAHTRSYIQRIQSIMPPGSVVDATSDGAVEDA